MRTGKNGNADHIDIFLQRHRHNFLRRLVQAGVDHLKPGVTQGAGDDFAPRSWPSSPGFATSTLIFLLIIAPHEITNCLISYDCIQLLLEHRFFHPGAIDFPEHADHLADSAVGFGAVDRAGMTFLLASASTRRRSSSASTAPLSRLARNCCKRSS